jgi:peptidyl-prolyl cis-trans isomerase SurA
MPIQDRLTPLATRVALLVLVFGGACASKPPASPPVSPDAWAVVDGREIKRDEVEKAYRRMVDLSATPSDEEAMNAKLSLLNELITQNLLMAKAKALGVEVSGAEIETAFAERKKNVADDVFQKQLTQRGLTTADLKDDLRRDLTTQKLIEHEVGSKIAVSDQAVVAYYNANRGQFNLSEPAYRIAQIVVTPVREEQITNRQNDDAATPESAARKVKMIADRLHEGAKFSDLAMDYSEDPQTAPQGGDLGLVPASQLRQAPAPLRDAVLKAQPGTISQVNIGGGYTLVLVAAKEAAGQRDLTTPGVRDNIAAALRDRQRQLLQTAFLTVLRNDAQVVNVLAKQVLSQASQPPTLAPTAPGKKFP